MTVRWNLENTTFVGGGVEDAQRDGGGGGRVRGLSGAYQRQETT